jgi:hypothetical protein
MPHDQEPESMPVGSPFGIGPGAPGVFIHLRGRPYSVLILEVAHWRIHAIFIFSNPEKLAPLPVLSQAPSWSHSRPPLSLFNLEKGGASAP